MVSTCFVFNFRLSQSTSPQAPSRKRPLATQEYSLKVLLAEMTGRKIGKGNFFISCCFFYLFSFLFIYLFALCEKKTITVSKFCFLCLFCSILSLTENLPAVVNIKRKMLDQNTVFIVASLDTKHLFLKKLMRTGVWYSGYISAWLSVSSSKIIFRLSYRVVHG